MNKTENKLYSFQRKDLAVQSITCTNVCITSARIMECLKDIINTLTSSMQHTLYVLYMHVRLSHIITSLHVEMYMDCASHHT